MRERHRYINNASKTASVNSKHEVIGSNSAQKKYKLILNPADAVILHPSFLCPALKKTGDELHLFLLGDWRFNTTFENAEGKEDNKAGPALCGAINRFLKIVKWDSIDKGNHAPKPLFASPGEVKDNITVYKLWEVRKLKDGILTDYQGKKFAQVHPDVLQLYKDNLLSWGFEVVIKNLPMDGDPGLYDISWMNYARAEEEDESGYFFELQDEYINDFNKRYRRQYSNLSCDVEDDKCPTFEEKETEIQSYHPLYISDKPCLDIGHLSDVHVSSRQHLYTQSNARLIDGKKGGTLSKEIGEMVNTSYANLKNLMVQMSEDVDLLIFTGDLIDFNRNFNPNNSIDDPETFKKSSGIWEALNLKNLTDKTQYPIGIDNLVIYELFRWYYRTKKKPIMLVSGNHEAYTLPYGISPRVKLLTKSKIAYNPMNRFKSVDDFIQESNKQAEEEKNEVEAAKEAGKGPDIYDQRANEGIPADHNLTIPEALLMYGTDFARVPMSGPFSSFGGMNFNSDNLDWFYHVFTPLTSFYSLYGEQCFIGLGWGDNERFLSGRLKTQGKWKGGGFLPRSQDGVTDSQLDILNQALELEEPKINLLLSHFTFVNYDTSQPIGKEGTIDFGPKNTLYDYGTFESNRSNVYPLIAEKKIKYTLSGHSHRSGLYHITGKAYPAIHSLLSNTWTVKGQAAKIDKKFNPEAGCRILVAASGGPMPVQNHDNELFNWGLDRPSGNYIKFKGSSESEVGIKASTVPESKPRLAVALDYADIFLRDEDKSGAFSLFESKQDAGPFSLMFSEEIKLKADEIIENITLVIYTGKQDKDEAGNKVEPQIYTLNGNANSEVINTVSFKPNIAGFEDIIKKSVRDIVMGFVKITMKAGGKGTEVYETKKDWVYPIEILFRKDREIKKYRQKKMVEISRSMPINEQAAIAYAQEQMQLMEKHIDWMEKHEGGFIIQRHSLYGEIPDFDFYIKNFKEKYA